MSAQSPINSLTTTDPKVGALKASFGNSLFVLTNAKIVYDVDRNSYNAFLPEPHREANIDGVPAHATVTVDGNFGYVVYKTASTYQIGGDTSSYTTEYSFSKTD